MKGETQETALASKFYQNFYGSYLAGDSVWWAEQGVEVGHSGETCSGATIKINFILN